MTDQASNTLEQLVVQYELGVANPTEGDILAWFEARSTIEAQAEALSEPQLKRVEKADKQLIAATDDVLAALEQSGNKLADQRAKKARPTDEWWWYLDVLSPISDYYQAKPPTTTSQVLNWGFTGLQIVVLLIALFLIGRNVGIIPTPAPTVRPTDTPAPTETLIPGAFDLSKATTFKSPDNGLQFQLPPNWTVPTPAPGQAAPLGVYTFLYGANSQSPSVVMQVEIGEASTIYTGFGISHLTGDTTPTATAAMTIVPTVTPATASATEAATMAATAAGTPQPTATPKMRTRTPREALLEIKAGQELQGVTATDVTNTKLAGYDAVEMVLSFPASAQREAAEILLRVAATDATNNKVIYVLVQARTSIWPNVKDAISQMLDTMQISPDKLPTLTPTPTPTSTPTAIPLQLTQTAIFQTATAVQTQILLLTPTVTPTPGATAAATSAPTQAATTAPTAEGTQAATPTK